MLDVLSMTENDVYCKFGTIFAIDFVQLGRASKEFSEKIIRHFVSANL